MDIVLASETKGESRKGNLMATMTVEQGKCEIYPSRQNQLCMRVRVFVVPLTPAPDSEGDWIEDGSELRRIELRCSQDGLNRLLNGIDNATNPPKKRKAKPDVPKP